LILPGSLIASNGPGPSLEKIRKGVLDKKHRNAVETKTQIAKTPVAGGESETSDWTGDF